MGKDFSDTPKGTITVSNLGPGFDGAKHLKGGVTNTIKYKKDALTASLAFTDKSLTPPTCKKFQDVIATVDYKAGKGVTVNANYELGTKKYKAGLTFDTKIASKPVTLKGWYTNKDNLVSGDATVTLDKTKKLNIAGNQKKISSAKLTLTQGSWTVEPSYNFDKKSPAVAVTKKVKKDSFKATYDLKSEAAALEWARAPFKLTLAAPVGVSKIGKPTVSAIYEKTFEF